MTISSSSRWAVCLIKAFVVILPIRSVAKEVKDDQTT